MSGSSKKPQFNSALSLKNNNRVILWKAFREEIKHWVCIHEPGGLNWVMQLGMDIEDEIKEK